MALYLFLIRHGETEWTKERRFQGSSDIPLTKRGMKQAKAVAECLKRYGIDRIYASPLGRARQTAAPIARLLRKKINYDKRLRELGFGVWEGRTSRELLSDKKSQYAKWCLGKIVTPKRGEKISDFRKRVRSFLSDVTRQRSSASAKKIAVVTHGGPVKIILFEALRLPFRSLWSFRIETASISVLGIGKDFAQVYSLNDVSHLPHHLTAPPDYMA